MTARLSINSAGRLAGRASISYNSPWPCPNGSYGMGAVHGAIMHTMVGNLPSTINAFNNPSFNASAQFGIDQAGHIHQFGPIGNWVAWHVAAGNANWIGVEHADNGNPNNPLTNAQLTASAQILEALATHYGFPLQVTNSTTGRGYGTHSMGGAAWGGHSCPDIGGKHVRSSQRAEVVRRAGVIRSGGSVSTGGPEHWDAADWKAFTTHMNWLSTSNPWRDNIVTPMLWWLSRSLAGQTTPGMTPAQAGWVTDLHAKLVEFFAKNPAPAPPTAAQIATAVVAELGTESPDLPAIEAATEAALRRVFADTTTPDAP